MASTTQVPDAWDDDWESQADKAPQSVEEILESMPKLSKAERKAKQAELNRKLWQEAEAPRANYYVETRNSIPMQSDPKPTVKVLSRKPIPALATREGLSSGFEKLDLEDDDDDDEESSKPQQLTPEERQRQAQRDREEKQRKYEEARERLFGTPIASSSSRSHNSSPSQDRGRGRGRGGRPTSSGGTKTRHTLDTSHNPKPESTHWNRPGVSRTHSPLTADHESITRQPRGPDGTGRGFVGRRGREP